MSSALFTSANAVVKVDHIPTELPEILFLLAPSPNILIKHRCCCCPSDTSVFVHVGLSCRDTRFLSLPKLECDSSWVTSLMPWQRRKCQTLVRSNGRLIFRRTYNIYNKEPSDEGCQQAEQTHCAFYDPAEMEITARFTLNRRFVPIQSCKY